MNPLETYLKHVRDIRSTGAATDETSFYPALSNLFNEIGKILKPKVRCVINLANRGAGLPDGGFFTADQFRRGQVAEFRAGFLPARGAMEAKSPAEDVSRIAQRKQVRDYVGEYGLVLVTNLRDFLLVGRNAQGNPVPMEGFTLAENEAAFWTAAAHPQRTAQQLGERFWASSGDTIPLFSLRFPWSAGAAGHGAARPLLFEARRLVPDAPC